MTPNETRAEIARLRETFVLAGDEQLDLAAEVVRLRAKIARVEALLDDDDDPYIHVHIFDQNQPEPDCARCWTLDIRAALADPEEATDAQA